MLSIATSYDANGNPTAYSESYSDDSVRQTTRAYDDYDRLTQVTDGIGRTIAYAYDNNGNRTGLTDPDSITTTYGYDADNRLSQVTTGGGATRYTYDGSGQITQISNPNGTVTRQGHDGAGRLTTISHGEGANTLAVYSYSYDANGNRLTQSETQNGITEHTTYGFDSADRMTSAAYPDKTVSYSYDANYNRLSETTTASDGTVSSDKSYSYNSRNQLTAITDALDAAQSISYQYDANGNQTVKSKNGVTTTYLWENFAAFAKLFSKRLKGGSPEQIDLAGLALAGFTLKPQKDIEEEGEKYTLKPIGPNEAEPSDREKEFLHQIIARMNDLFGDVADDMGQRHFTTQVVNIARDNPRVVEQVEKNTKEQAMQGDLPDVVRQATVSAMKSHNDLARTLLKDSQHMAAFFSLVYDLIKHGEASSLIE